MSRALAVAGVLGTGVVLVFGAAILAFSLAGPSALVWSAPRERMIVVDDGFQVLPRDGGIRVPPPGGVWAPDIQDGPAFVDPPIELIPVAPDAPPPADGAGTLDPDARL